LLIFYIFYKTWYLNCFQYSSEETGVPRENHWPVASHWQTLPHNVVSITHRLSGIRTHNFSGDRHCLNIIPTSDIIDHRKHVTFKNNSTWIFSSAATLHCPLLCFTRVWTIFGMKWRTKITHRRNLFKIQSKYRRKRNLCSPCFYNCR
jgi:hypothetical protein